MQQSGDFGTVDGVPSIRSWSLSRTKANTKQSASNTKSGTNREAGPLDWSGTYAAYGANPSDLPGEYVALELYQNPDETGDPDNGIIWSGTALVTQIAITVNFQTNDPISYVVSFGGHGALTKSAGAPYADASAPSFLTPCAGYVQLVKTPTPVRVSHVQQAVLTITREAKTSVNSGASDASGKCTTLRYPGGAIDWTLALTRDEGNLDADMDEGDVVELKLFVDNTNFWHLKWGMVRDPGNITVNRETGDIISYTANIEMKAANGGVLGFIKQPGASTNWWPAA